MNETFYRKTGLTITELAQELLQMNKGEKLPIISELQLRLGVSRGTVQNALTFLKEQGAIALENKGHLGTYLSAIDYQILQKYAISDQVVGTMPLPYSRLYEGFATGLYECFSKHNIRLNMAYVRGSKDRIQSVINGVYGFAVTSKFAADRALQEGAPIKIILDFGPHSYLSQHILLFADNSSKQIEDGMRIAIDSGSFDQRELTNSLTHGFDVTFVEMPGHQIIHGLREGIIDAGVWNYDEIIDKNYQDLNYRFIEGDERQVDMTRAVIIVAETGSMIETIVKKNVEIAELLKVQQSVMAGAMIPRY